MLRRAAALLLTAVAPATAQSTAVTLGNAGSGRQASILRAALAAPHVVLGPEGGKIRLPRDSTFVTTVIVLGNDAAVGSTVHGSVIVVGGDLFLHPGAAIDGRAVAIGGAVYNSALATVRGEMLSFRELTYDIRKTRDGVVLDVRPLLADYPMERFSLPGLSGLRAATYDRVDGLSVTWGPRVALDSARFTLDPLVTYRSDLGAFDLGATSRAELTPRLALAASAARGTWSNDDWIQSDLVNSLSVLVHARDYRNYWRADRIEGRLERDWSTGDLELLTSLGARTERDWSVGAGGPWSVTGQSSVEGIERANPSVLRGRVSSVLAGAHGSWERELVRLSGGAELEVPWDTPNGSRFLQATLDFGVTFPTFGTQSFQFRSHAVLTAGDTAPRQRFAYLGGAGTLPTFRVLQFGGDQLLLLDSRYDIPITAIHVPIAGSPIISLRDLLGAAGPGRLPSLEQNVGVRLTLSVLAVDFLVDPVARRGKWFVTLAAAR